jgi:hypothetical protein
MNSEEFVSIIREMTIDDSVRIIQSNLIKPPGRGPSEAMLRMSNWYNGLSDANKSILLEVIKYSVETGVFEFLCILDGVRTMENENRGELKLFYERGDERVLLNDQHKVNLHRLL